MGQEDLMNTAEDVADQVTFIFGAASCHASPLSTSYVSNRLTSWHLAVALCVCGVKVIFLNGVSNILYRWGCYAYVLFPLFILN